MINQVVLVGRLTQAPRKVEGAGPASVELLLEVERASRFGARPVSCTVAVRAFGDKRIEPLLKYLRKGRSVLVHGRLASDAGALLIVGDSVEFMEDGLQSRGLFEPPTGAGLTRAPAVSVA